MCCFADANWGNDNHNRKSTSGILLQLGGTSLSWMTLKLTEVALSATEHILFLPVKKQSHIYGFAFAGWPWFRSETTNLFMAR